MHARIFLIAALLGVLAAEGDAAAQPLTPQQPGWERYFEVTWERWNAEDGRTSAAM